MNSQHPGHGRSRVKNGALWALQVLVAAAFVLAGFAKLSGQTTMVEMFDKIGLGQWFRYVTGGIQVASAILLVLPRLAPLGALLLVGTMIGAILAHLLKLGGSPVPAIVLGGFAAIILWGRSGPLKAWHGRRPEPAVPAAAPGGVAIGQSEAR